MKYKSDCKKYCKSEVEKYKSISIKIKGSERGDQYKLHTIWWPNLEPSDATFELISVRKLI